MKILHFSTNYHASDIDYLEDQDCYYTNLNGESLLYIDDNMDMSELSSDLREELQEGLKHKSNVFVLV